jgi:polygalacturonase
LTAPPGADTLRLMPRIVITDAGSATDDHRELIHRALDAVDKAGGGDVVIPDGTHMLGPLPDNQIPPQAGGWSLQIGDNTHLQLGAGATLVRRFAGGGINSTIRNKNVDQGNKNIRITGGTIKTLGPANAGKHLAFAHVDGLAIRDVRFEGVTGDWNVAISSCTDVTVSGVVMNSGSQIYEDGLHFMGGERIAVTNCIIHCGDDALSFTQEAPDEKMDLTDVVVSNCYLWSEKANAVRIWAVEGKGRALRRIRLSNIVAKVGTDAEHSGNGIVIQDQNRAEPTSDSRISDVEIDGFWLDASRNGASPVIIDGVDRVRLHRVVCWQPATRITIDSSRDVELTDCVVDAPRGEAAQCVIAGAKGDCTNLRIRGGAYRGARHHAIVLGAEKRVDGFEVSNVQIAHGALSGLVLGRTKNGLVFGNTLGDNASWGIEETKDSADNEFMANRLQRNAAGAISAKGARSRNVRGAPNR